MKKCGILFVLCVLACMALLGGCGKKESADGTHGLILGMDEELRYGGGRQQETVAYQIMTEAPIDVVEVHMLKVKKDALTQDTVRANAWQAAE